MSFRSASRIACLIVLAVLWSAAAGAQKRPTPYALIVGTVFYDENGFLVRGASVEIRQKEGKKRWDAQTNDQGEFSVRVPAARAVYLVTAKAAGRLPDQKEVEVNLDERVDVVLHLKAK